jgi:3-aminobutyryl-CoA ammonia-lyase
MTLAVGFSVTHKRYVPYAHAHYGGDLVDGAYGLGMFGDIATELCIRTDGDEGLFAGYLSVEFLAPIQAGDVLEATATITRIGNRSRTVDFEARVLCRSRGGSSSAVLEPPLVVTRATGTVVVP